MARTFNDAYQLARPIALAGNRAEAEALLSRLLWHVDMKDGGFIGLSDAQLRRKCKEDPRLNYSAATSASWAPGEWPAAEQVAA